MCSSDLLLLRTTPYFLERMGLAALEDLPPIAEHLPMPDSVVKLVKTEWKKIQDGAGKPVY